MRYLYTTMKLAIFGENRHQVQFLITDFKFNIVRNQSDVSGKIQM